MFYIILSLPASIFTCHINGLYSQLFNNKTSCFLKRGLESTYCFHIPHTYSAPSQVDLVRVLHLVIRKFVTLGIADFANTKSMGKPIFECALLTKNAMY